MTALERSRMYLLRGPPVPASPGYHFLIRPGLVRDIVARERPDIIEVGSPFLAPWLVQRALRPAPESCAVVGYFHADARQVYVEHGLRALPGPARNGLGDLLDRHLSRAYRAMAATIAATPGAAKVLRDLGIDNVRLIPLGTNPEVFHPDRRDPAWRNGIGVGPGCRIALYVGRLSSDKRLDVMLGALPALHQATGIHVVLVGEGHLRGELQAFARKHPDLLTVLPFEADRPRLARIYASADLYLAPFPNETFGLATVEAMASGLPVVGVNSGGTADLLGGAPWARLYHPGDSADLSRAVQDVLAQDLRALGRQARETARTRFSWEQTFSSLFALYRDLVPSSSRTPSVPVAANFEAVRPTT